MSGSSGRPATPLAATAAEPEPSRPNEALPDAIEAYCGTHGEYDRAIQGSRAGPGCIATDGCDLPLLPVPRCAEIGAARAVGDLDVGRIRVGQELRLYGVLRVLGTSTTGIMCGIDSPPCCNQSNGVLGVVDVRDVDTFRMPAAMLANEAFTCSGDDSAVCCRVDAVCRTVVVTGRVMSTLDDFSRGRRASSLGVRLDVSSICFVGPKSAPTIPP